MIAALAAAGRHGRWLLVGGLAAGLALPGVAAHMVPWLPQMVACLLFLAVLRIGPARMLGTLGDMRATLFRLAVLQLMLPLAACGLLAVAGLLGSPAGMALALVFAAAPLAGSPNLTLLLGYDPAPALRLVVLGTALLPLTALPIFWALPGLSGGADVLGASARLLLVIGLAAAAATLVRRYAMPDPGAQTLAALDGLSAIAMAVVVVALMATVGPTLATDPVAVGLWLALATTANFGAQAVAALALRRQGAASVPVSVVAGNRNIALFLVALPEEAVAALLLFIGCYQVPMYLTPLLMRPFYRHVAGDRI